MTENLEDDESNDNGTSSIHRRHSDNRWFWEQSYDDDYFKHRLMGKYYKRGGRYSNQLVVRLARRLLMSVNGHADIETRNSNRRDERNESRRPFYSSFIQDWLWLIGYLLKKNKVDYCY